MTRYRRRRLTREDTIASAAASVAVGLGVATVTFYLTRLFLSREPLTESERPKLPGTRAHGTLPPGAENGHDPGR
ncbi:MAG: hypothetical protein AMS19_02300 [Gemmatimonas sp. SG8_23]|jgi:hypothetical protein|nr:MAG: hypothetical protein AMS19_02300 [Gemmatimonas sp. SG8_23]